MRKRGSIYEEEVVLSMPEEPADPFMTRMWSSAETSIEANLDSAASPRVPSGSVPDCFRPRGEDGEADERDPDDGEETAPSGPYLEGILPLALALALLFLPPSRPQRSAFGLLLLLFPLLPLASA